MPTIIEFLRLNGVNDDQNAYITTANQYVNELQLNVALPWDDEVVVAPDRNIEQPRISPSAKLTVPIAYSERLLAGQLSPDDRCGVLFEALNVIEFRRSGNVNADDHFNDEADWSLMAFGRYKSDREAWTAYHSGILYAAIRLTKPDLISEKAGRNADRSLEFETINGFEVMNRETPQNVEAPDQEAYLHLPTAQAYAAQWAAGGKSVVTKVRQWCSRYQEVLKNYNGPDRPDISSQLDKAFEVARGSISDQNRGRGNSDAYNQLLNTLAQLPALMGLVKFKRTALAKLEFLACDDYQCPNW